MRRSLSSVLSLFLVVCIAVSGLVLPAPAYAEGGTQSWTDTHYTDEFGAVYRFISYTIEEITHYEAVLESIPAGVEEYTVPSTVPKKSGDSIIADATVSEIASNALLDAVDLVSIGFETPQFVSLMTNSLRSPSGKLEKVAEGGVIVSTDSGTPLTSDGTQVYTSMFAAVANDIGFPVAKGELPSLKESTQQEDSFFNIAILVKNRQPGAGKTAYELYTGDVASFVFAVSNGDMNTHRVVRVFFEVAKTIGVDGESGVEPEISPYVPGETYYLKNSINNSSYPLKVTAVDTGDDSKYIFYYDIQGSVGGEGSDPGDIGFKPGETLGFESSLYMPSPKSAGGDLRVWAQIVDDEEDPLLLDPENWIRINWATRQSDFYTTKTFARSAGSALYPRLYTSPSSDKVYLTNVQYTIRTLMRQESDSSTHGRDYVQRFDYEDVITLPGGTDWSEGILDAIKEGRYSLGTVSRTNETSTAVSSRSIVVNGRIILYMSQAGKDPSEIRNLKVDVVEDGGVEKLCLRWSYTNSSKASGSISPDREIELPSYFIKIENNVVEADMAAVNSAKESLAEGETYSVKNDIKETAHYTWGEPREFTVPTVSNTVTAAVELSVSKSWNTTSRLYRGQANGSRITIANSGSDYSKKISSVTDSIPVKAYIKPEDIEKMLLDETIQDQKKEYTYDLGKWLTITITNAYKYKPGTTILNAETQSNKYVFSQNINAYTVGNNDAYDRTLISNSGRIVLKKTDEGKISLAYTDAKNPDHAVDWIIGEGGDHPSVESAFEALGFIVGYSTVYSLSWSMNEGDLVIPTGSNVVFPVRSTWKTTPMMLTIDTASQSQSNTSVTNYAYVTANGEGGRLSASQSAGDPYNELILTKASSFTSNSSTLEFIDRTFYPLYTLTLSNYSRSAYESMPVVDLVKGPQLVMVPYEENKDNASIKAVMDPEDEENQVMLNNMKFLLLRPGASGTEAVYRNVVLGVNAASSNVATYIGTNVMKYTADSVTVKKAASGLGAETMIRWELQNWGETTSATIIRYNTYLAPGDKDMGYTAGITTAQSFTNDAWLGDHQGRRLKASVNGTLTKTNAPVVVRNPGFGRAKYIRNSDESFLTTSRQITEGANVTYELVAYTYDNPQISNRTFAGNTFYDNLPANISWTRDGDGIKNGIVRGISFLTERPDDTKIIYTDPETGNKAEYVFDNDPVSINISTNATANMKDCYKGHWNDPHGVVGDNGANAWTLENNRVTLSPNLSIQLPDSVRNEETNSITYYQFRMRMEVSYPSDRDLWAYAAQMQFTNYFYWTKVNSYYSSVHPALAVEPFYVNKKIVLTEEGEKKKADTSKIDLGMDVEYEISLERGAGKDYSEIIRGIQLADMLPGTAESLPWKADPDASGKENMDYAAVKAVRFRIEGDRKDEASVYIKKGEDIAHYDLESGEWDNAELASNAWYVTKTPFGSGWWYYTLNSYTSARNSVSLSTANYYLRFDNDLEILLPPNCTLYIDVDTRYPSDETAWEKAMMYFSSSGASVRNLFLFARRSGTSDSLINTSSSAAVVTRTIGAQVTHTTVGDISAVFRQGVLDTGWTRLTVTGTQANIRYLYTSRGTRSTYANSPESGLVGNHVNTNASTATYYAVLYNNGTEKLDFDNFIAKLPDGFEFDSICTNYAPGVTSYYSGWYSRTSNGVINAYNPAIGYFGGFAGTIYSSAPTNITTASGTNYGIARIDDPEFTGSKSLVGTTVTASVAKGADGCQYVTFTPGIKTLIPGKALVFAYNVKIHSHSRTYDEAVNTMAVAYNNVYRRPLNTGDVEKIVSADPRDNKNYVNALIKRNDGGLTQKTTEELEEEGFTLSAYKADNFNTEENGNWLVSTVKLTRDGIKPGLQKSVGGYTTVSTDNTNPYATFGAVGVADSAGIFGMKYDRAVQKNQIVNWKVRVYNETTSLTEQTNTMQPYTLVDTIDSPYSFVGTVYYSTYYENTNLGVAKIMEKNPVYLFTIAPRTWTDEDRDSETGFKVARGSSISASTAKEVAFGEWFDFGSGRMKIDRVRTLNNKTYDYVYNEVMTIELTNDLHSVRDGRFHEWKISTQFASNTLPLGEMLYNDIKLYPHYDDPFSPDFVSQGSPFEAKDDTVYAAEGGRAGVESGASIMVSHGYATSAEKRAYEKGKPGVASSSDLNGNKIVLTESRGVLTYDLIVNTPVDDPMGRLTVIDALPEPGDHTAFIENEMRGSTLTVNFDQDDPGFVVYLRAGRNGTERALDPSQYTLQIAGPEKRSFDRYDWEGINRAGDGWHEIKAADMNSDETKALLKEGRSVRITISDPNITNPSARKMIPAESRIRISFNAVIDAPDAKPGDTAWNSFGYNYSVIPTGTTEILMDAQPLASGVVFSRVPTIKKELVDIEGDPFEAPEDMSFGYIIYSGNVIPEIQKLYLDLEDHTTADDRREINKKIADLLKASGREYTYVKLDLEEGESESEEVVLSDAVQYTYDEDELKWIPLEDAGGNTSFINWKHGNRYTVFELPIENYHVNVRRISAGASYDTQNALTFTQNSASTVRLVGQNVYDPAKVDLNVVKTWDDARDQDGKRPKSITVHLYADGNDTPVADMKVKASDGWKYTFKDLPVYHSNGEAIKYTVMENRIDDYTRKYPDEFDGIPDSAGEDDVTITITNKYTPKKTSVEYLKVWEDDFDRDGIRPDSIEVSLYANGVKTEATQTVTEEDGWHGVFGDLDEYSGGKKIVYTVAEDEVPEGYTVASSGAMNTGIRIINTHEPEMTSVSVTKKWDIPDEYADRIPEEVEIILYANGKPVEEYSLTKMDDWSHTFKDLYRYEKGEEIEYTISEVEVEGFDTKIKGDADRGFTVTNSFIPLERPKPDPKPVLNTWDHFAYIVGYPDGTVQPYGTITRAEVATIFFRLLTDDSRASYWSSDNDFSDVSAENWFNNAVSTLSSAGILSGYPDGSFAPQGSITRAELATITARFLSETEGGSESTRLTDIEGSWASEYIKLAEKYGVLEGYEDFSFRPAQPVTRAEAMTMINRLLGRKPDKDHLLADRSMLTWPDNSDKNAWYYAAVQEATNSHEYSKSGIIEIWTKKLSDRDWTQLENEWSNARSR